MLLSNPYICKVCGYYAILCKLPTRRGVIHQKCLNDECKAVNRLYRFRIRDRRTIDLIMSSSNCFDRAEFARRFGLDMNAVNYLIRTGRVPFFSCRGKIVFRECDMDYFNFYFENFHYAKKI